MGPCSGAQATDKLDTAHGTCTCHLACGSLINHVQDTKGNFFIYIHYKLFVVVHREEDFAVVR